MYCKKDFFPNFLVPYLLSQYLDWNYRKISVVLATIALEHTF